MEKVYQEKKVLPTYQKKNLVNKKKIGNKKIFK